MTLVRTIFCLAMIAVVSLTSGVVMSKYKADMENSAQEYADLMTDIPTEFGVWKQTKEADLPDYALEQLKVSNAKNWTYINEQTKDIVRVSFLVGPTGRLSVHTPEACMDGRGYKISQSRQRERFAGNNSSTQGDGDEDSDSSDSDTFWRVAIVNKANDYQFVSYYALGTGKKWWAKDNPRFELSQYPFILKMQVETATGLSDPDSGNAAHKFLKEFLPEVAGVFTDTDLEGKYGK